MADKQSPTEKAAHGVDPTVRSRGDVPEYPEGTHPPAPISEQSWSADRLNYADVAKKDKPDPSSIVQTVEEDPLAKESQDVLRKDAQHGARETAKQSEDSK